tara:strand:- start:308 stop:760 length:453 start_codon:yes stop_codon:yes gene_type:complete
MKKVTLLLCLTVPLISVSQALKDENNSELNFYGNEFKLPEDDNFSNDKLSVSIIKGKVISNCPKKGCWVKVDVNSEEIFVTFKNYSFFVPKEGIQGKNIIINGDIKIDTISIPQLKHYAYDAGKSEDIISKINEPKITKSIEATGVAIID